MRLQFQDFCSWMLLIILFILDVNIGTIYCGNHEGWSYSSGGSQLWATSYPACGGDFQSPIDILDGDLECDSSLRKIKMLRTTKSEISTLEFTLTNNGHSAQISFPTSTFGVSLDGSNLATHEVVQLHFHWGSDAKSGSEHKTNGKAYPVETHVVSFKKAYGDLQTALTKSDGLAVLGFLHELDDSASERESQKNLLGSLNKDLQLIINNGQTIKMNGFDLLKIMDQVDPSSYYRYQGSLTRPPCTESVVWTVFKKPVAITTKQLELFRALQFPDGTPMVNNFRPTQSVNKDKRKIYQSDSK